MKQANILRACILATMLGCCVLPEAALAATPTVQIENADWQNPARLRKKLAEKLVAGVPGLSKKKMKEFLSNEANLNLLLNRHLAWVESNSGDAYRHYREQVKRWVQEKEQQCANHKKNAGNLKGSEADQARFLLGRAEAELKELKDELRRPVSIADVMSNAEAAQVVKRICGDNEWMENLVFSGELNKPGRVMGMIASAAAKDKKLLKQRIARETATATALEYARNDWSMMDAEARTDYFVRNWRNDRLNSVYGRIPFWQRRIVCGWKNQHSSGTVKAFEWALNNVHLPANQYPDCCWRCGYISDNMFGDSVQTGWYAAPFYGVYDDNHFAFTQYVGGVCGGLSHFGAAAACANGVPALTAGEPGHCAYIVNVDGRWVPAYSLSWERGLHWIPWDSNWTFTALHLTSDLNDEKAVEDKRLSNAYRIMAHAYEECGQVDKALRCFVQAASAQPLNYPIWREYAAFLSRHKAQDVAAWEKLNEQLCKGVAPKYPEQAGELLKQFVYAPLSKSGISQDKLRACFTAFWKNAETMGPDRWYIETLANQQMNYCLNAGQGDAEGAAYACFRDILAAAAPHDAYSGPIMGWGNSVTGKLGADGDKKLMKAMTEALSAGSKMTDEQRSRLLGRILITAERARDASTYHAIAKMIPDKVKKADNDIPEFAAFPGKLVSEGGMVFASSTSQWDAPHTHPGLLTKKGGKIHTGKDNNAWIAVKLPRHAHISGVVFAGTNKWDLIHRFRPLQIQISDTGNDDDWHDVGEAIPNTGNYINRFDLQNQNPKALYIRVLRRGGPEFFHADGIFVYGKPAA